MVTIEEFRAFCQLVGRPMSNAEAYWAQDVAKRLEQWIMAQALRERQAQAQSDGKVDD